MLKRNARTSQNNKDIEKIVSSISLLRENQNDVKSFSNRSFIRIIEVKKCIGKNYYSNSEVMYLMNFYLASICRHCGWGYFSCIRLETTVGFVLKFFENSKFFIVNVYHWTPNLQGDGTTWGIHLGTRLRVKVVTP